MVLTTEKGCLEGGSHIPESLRLRGNDVTPCPDY